MSKVTRSSSAAQTTRRGNTLGGGGLRRGHTGADAGGQFLDGDARMRWSSPAAPERYALLEMTVADTVVAMFNAVVVSTSGRRSEFASVRLTGLTRVGPYV